MATITATPATLALASAKKMEAKAAAAGRAELAERELRKLTGTRRQFGRLTASEQKRLDAARRTMRQDGWAIGK